MKVNLQTIANRIGTNYLLVIFLLFPFLMKGQIQSSNMVYVLNNYYDDQVVSANEVNYYGLVCDPTSELPKAKKGKYFCQTQCSLKTNGATPVYQFTKRYYNDQKRLACILYFSLDSTKSDTIQKSKELYLYEKGLLKSIITQELIDKVDKYSVHGDKLRNILSSDTIHIHYSYTSLNCKKGYYLDSDVNDTFWFHYKWSKTGGSGYQITSYSRIGDVAMKTNVNQEGFYQYSASMRNFAGFVFGTFSSSDSLLIQYYSPALFISKSQNESPFEKTLIVYEDTIAHQTIEAYSKTKYVHSNGIKILKDIRYNKGRMPLWMREMNTSQDSKTKTTNYTYSYETRIE